MTQFDIPTSLSPGHVMGESKMMSLAEPIDGITDLLYVNIPKNASCWMKNHFDGVDVNYYQSLNPRHHRVLVVLRDPVERWISGFVQMISGDDPNGDMGIDNIVWDNIFETVAYDNHTQSQSDFVANIPHRCIDWFWFDHTLVDSYVDYMLNYSIKIQPKQESSFGNENIFNRTSNDKYRQYLTKRVTEVLNPDYRSRLQEFYKRDYELIESVKFYGTR